MGANTSHCTGAVESSTVGRVPNNVGGRGWEWMYGYAERAEGRADDARRKYRTGGAGATRPRTDEC